MTLFKIIKFLLRLPFILIRINYEIKLSKNNSFGKVLLCFTYLKLIFFTKTRDDKNDNVLVKIHGNIIKARTYSSLLFLYKEIFISETYYLSSLRPSSLIVDCGSNIGMSILYFKLIYPQCSIMGFEPDSETYKLLQFNIKKNNLKDVIVYPKALAFKEETIQYYQNQSKGGLTSSIFMNRDTFSNEVKIESVRLSDFIAKVIPDLIKIDVEGAEFLIIEDLIKNNLFKNQKRFIIEYHHRINNSKSRLSSFLNYLEINDFEYSIKATYKNECLFQDIILYVFAKNKD